MTLPVPLDNTPGHQPPSSRLTVEPPPSTPAGGVSSWPAHVTLYSPMFDAMIAMASYTANIARTAGTSSVSIMITYYRLFCKSYLLCRKEASKRGSCHPVTALRPKAGRAWRLLRRSEPAVYVVRLPLCRLEDTQAANQLCGSTYLDPALATRLFPERGHSTHTPLQGQDHDHRRPPLTVIATTLNLRQLSRGNSPEQPSRVHLKHPASVKTSHRRQRHRMSPSQEKLVVHVVVRSPFRCDNGPRRRWSLAGMRQ